LTFDVPNLAQNNINQSDLARDAIFNKYHDETSPFDQIKALYGVHNLTLLTTDMKVDSISRFRPDLVEFIRRRNPYLNIVRGNFISSTEEIKEPEKV
jgi:hypothetical protein